jgi:hypothetical protein
MSVVSQSWTVQSIFCLTHVHSTKGAMNFTTDSCTLPSVTLHVSNPFANRMASIIPHDRIGKTLHKLWYKKKEEEEEEAAVTCVSMLANKEKLLLSRNPRKRNLDVIASASSEFSHRTSSISLFCFGFFAAIAVSGGPDSMALCILTAKWWQQQQQVKRLSHSVIEEAAGGMMLLLLSNHVVGTVVDHGLHPESVVEALCNTGSQD